MSVRRMIARMLPSVTTMSASRVSPRNRAARDRRRARRTETLRPRSGALGALGRLENAHAMAHLVGEGRPTHGDGAAGGLEAGAAPRLDDLLQLGDLRRDDREERVESRLLLRVVGGEGAEGGRVAGDQAQRVAIGGQAGLVSGDDVPALIGLRVAEVEQEGVEGVEHALGVVHPAPRLLEAREADGGDDADREHEEGRPERGGPLPAELARAACPPWFPFGPRCRPATGWRLRGRRLRRVLPFGHRVDTLVVSVRRLLVRRYARRGASIRSAGRRSDRATRRAWPARRRR